MIRPQRSNATETYRAFADLYDAYAGYFSDDLEFYRNICKPDDHVLEIGCGTGRILEFLLQRNCHLAGVDISEEMLEKARQKLSIYIENKSLRLINQNFTYLPLPQRNYNKVLITFYTFNYILKKPVDFLTHTYDSLTTNAEIYIDLLYPRALKNKSIDNRWTEKNLVIGSQPIII